MWCTVGGRGSGYKPPERLDPPVIHIHGDRELAAELVGMVGKVRSAVAAAVISPHGTSVTSIGASLDDDFEIGSISKVVTGMLYADAIERGEVTSSTTLSECLPLARTDVAAVTLGSLSTHTSGLPSQPYSAAQVAAKLLRLWATGANPYGESLETLIAAASEVRLGRTRTRYSNLGFELLGHALAARAGLSYAELLCDRIGEPLGLDPFYVADADDELTATAVAGTSRFGRPRKPWTGQAIGPAGGIRASVRAMAELIAALLEGTAPGAASMDPVPETTGKWIRIGAGWLSFEREGRTITWHNGGTGGFGSWIGLDRLARTGVVVVSATEGSVDRTGFRLLERAATNLPQH